MSLGKGESEMLVPTRTKLFLFGPISSLHGCLCLSFAHAGKSPQNVAGLTVGGGEILGSYPCGGRKGLHGSSTALSCPSPSSLPLLGFLTTFILFYFIFLEEEYFLSVKQGAN